MSVEGGLVLIPSTAGFSTAGSFATVSLTQSMTDSIALTAMPVSMIPCVTTLTSMQHTDIVAAAAAEATIHSNDCQDDDDNTDQTGSQDPSDENGDAQQPTVIIEQGSEDNVHIKSETPPLESPYHIQQVTLQPHQLQAAALLPAHTILEMIPQSLIEHQQRLQQQQQQLQLQHDQLVLYQREQQQQLELQQQHQQQQEQTSPKTGKGSKAKSQTDGSGSNNSGGNVSRTLTLLLTHTRHH